MFGDKQFGIPRGGVPTPLFYNKAAFDEAGCPIRPPIGKTTLGRGMSC
jgi:ABC-type glycerol-3-phosphate transport system substrate-binding protein